MQIMLISYFIISVQGQRCWLINHMHIMLARVRGSAVVPIGVRVSTLLVNSAGKYVNFSLETNFVVFVLTDVKSK